MSDRQIIHHLTTALGAVQVTESGRGVYFDFDNTATGINMHVQRWRGTIEIVDTDVYCFETPNMKVTYGRFDDSMPEEYRDLVTFRFEQEIDGQVRESSFYFYMDPTLFKKAVANMTEEKLHTTASRAAEATDENP